MAFVNVYSSRSRRSCIASTGTITKTLALCITYLICAVYTCEAYKKGFELREKDHLTQRHRIALRGRIPLASDENGSRDIGILGSGAVQSDSYLKKDRSSRRFIVPNLPKWTSLLKLTRSSTRGDTIDSTVVPKPRSSGKSSGASGKSVDSSNGDSGKDSSNPQTDLSTFDDMIHLHVLGKYPEAVALDDYVTWILPKLEG
jgi:hypothetical protein